MSDQSDKDQRIAALEQEVARLRGAQGGGPTGEESDADDVEQAWIAGSAEPGDDADDLLLLEAHMPSRRRAIVIAVTLGIVALVAIVAIVTAMSNVIVPLSKSAARALEPSGPALEQKSPEAPPAKAAPDPIRVPGL